MAPHSTQPDDLETHLRELHIPAANPQAVHRIVSHARAHPRPVWKWLGFLRQLRATIYLPQMRYAVMASLVGAFILIGLANPDHPAAPPQDLLADVTFDEEDPLDRFWLAGL